jgi:septum formation protein
MNTSAPPLLLASASPRRAEILRTLGIAHRVVPADIEEARRPGEAPEGYVERMAREKAGAVRALHPEAWVLAGDTTVAVDRRVLEKPADAAEAVQMLLALQGREHQVATGLALVGPEGVVKSGVRVTRVRFRAFDRTTARDYAATGEPMDKAGAYGIQGLGGALVEAIDGDFTTVVGLSVPLLVRLLERAGRPYRFPERGTASAAASAPVPAPESAAHDLSHVLQREISAMERQVLAYPDDALPWATHPEWPNSGGTLALHLAGNLRHFVGAVLGGSGYVRDRDAEFGRGDLSRAELAAELVDARLAVASALGALSPEALDEPWPGGLPGGDRGELQVRTRAVLLHLLSHAAYHLGQVDYHRRTVSGEPGGVGAIAMAELPTI